MHYDLILKGTVGWWDFNRDRVDDLLARKEGEEVNVLIDSLGGSLDEGLSICSAFANHGNVHVHFRGMNASAATVASMGAKRVTMDRSAMYLVHKASYMILEWDLLNADDLRRKAAEYSKQATDLEKMDLTIAQLYADRCKKDFADLLALMSEDKWLTSAEAVEWGLVDEVTSTGGSVRLTASTATAMATAGIPVPANMEIQPDGFLVRLEQMLQRFFGKNSSATGDADGPSATGDRHEVETNPQNTNTMKKTFLLIAAALGMEQAEMETNADGFFCFDEGQTDALENALADRDKTIADLQAAVDALKAQPADEPERVAAQTADTTGDPYSEFTASIAEARRMAAMLS